MEVVTLVSNSSSENLSLPLLIQSIYKQLSFHQQPARKRSQETQALTTSEEHLCLDL
jgi:hypothetical protein